MTRAAWALVGCIFTAGLFGIGYYLGYATTTAKWIERDAARAAVEQAQRDTLKAHLAAAETRASVAKMAMDSAIAGWERAAKALEAHVVSDAVKEPSAGAHGPTASAAPSAAPSAVVPAWDVADLSDTSRIVGALNACRVMVTAAEAYRSACEMVQDSLRAFGLAESQLAARATLQAKAWQSEAERAKRHRGFAVVAGAGVGADFHGHFGPVLAIVGGWRVF